MNLSEITGPLRLAFRRRHEAEGIDDLEAWVSVQQDEMQDVDPSEVESRANDILHDWTAEWWDPWHRMLTGGAEEPTAAGYSALRLRLDRLTVRAAEAEAEVSRLRNLADQRAAAEPYTPKVQAFMRTVLQLKGVPFPSAAALWRKVGEVTPHPEGDGWQGRAVASAFRRQGLLRSGESFTEGRSRIEAEAQALDAAPTADVGWTETKQANHRAVERAARADALDALLKLADLDVCGEWDDLWERFCPTPRAPMEEAPEWASLTTEERVCYVVFGELPNGVELPYGTMIELGTLPAAESCDTPRTGTVADADMAGAASFWSEPIEFNPAIGEPHVFIGPDGEPLFPLM